MSQQQNYNLLVAYQNDPVVRERLNAKGIYVNFDDNVSVTYYLTDEIHDSPEYHDFVEIAMVLESSDSIILMVDNGGGYVSGAQMLITAINNTEASTTAVITNIAASAATIISLACDDIVMMEHSYFMVHAVSFGSVGKLHEIAAHTEFAIERSKVFIQSVYEHFLTPEEIEAVIAGKDMYFSAEETMIRWGYVQDAREAKIKEFETERIKEHIEHLEANLKMLQDKLPKPEEKPIKKKVVKKVN